MAEGNSTNAEGTGKEARDGVTEVDPYKLVKKNGVLGFERAKDFEEVTNFDIEVCGYVGDGGHVLGYVLQLVIAVTDPLDGSTRTNKKIHLTNKQLGNHIAIVNALTSSSSAAWCAQSKDIYLPQYVYKLCTNYVKGPNPRRFKPVKIIGNQGSPESVWVFNDSVQMNRNGQRITDDEQVYVLMEDAVKLPQLVRISGEFDQGDALKKLIEAEKDLFSNNFPQVVLAHAASAMAANYRLIVNEFDGCATPVLKGHPVSGKTTALKAVLSVFGQKHFNSESTAKYIEAKQSSTTIPFGWDDCSCLKTLKACVLNSYNACGSANVRNSYIPQTVPIVTTNLDCPDIKFRSRWLRIPFEELDPKLKGQARIEAEKNLRDAMDDAHKSIPVVTSWLQSAINQRIHDEGFVQSVATVEEFAEKNAIDQRAQNMFAVLLFCTRKILKQVDCEQFYPEIKDKMLSWVMPSYLDVNDDRGANLQGVSCIDESKANVKAFLKKHLPQAALNGETDQVLTFFDQDYCPSSCCCGACIAFSVQEALNFVEGSLGPAVVSGLTAHAVRQFIKISKIGCVGSVVRFRGSNKQVHAAHIQHGFFNADDISTLHEKLGKRKKVKQSKKGTRRPAGDELTSVTASANNCNTEEKQQEDDPRRPAVTASTYNCNTEENQQEDGQRCPAVTASANNCNIEENQQEDGQRRPAADIIIVTPVPVCSDSAEKWDSDQRRPAVTASTYNCNTEENQQEDGQRRPAVTASANNCNIEENQQEDGQRHPAADIIIVTPVPICSDSAEKWDSDQRRPAVTASTYNCNTEENQQEDGQRRPAVTASANNCNIEENQQEDGQRRPAADIIIVTPVPVCSDSAEKWDSDQRRPAVTASANNCNTEENQQEDGQSKIYKYVMDQDDLDKLALDEELFGYTSEEMESQSFRKPVSRRKKKGNAADALTDSLTPKYELPLKRARKKLAHY